MTGTIPLVAGALSARFDDGVLRDVRIGDRILLEAVYVAVRDANWGTVTGHRSEVRTDGTGLVYEVSHVDDEIAFSWQARIEARPGRLEFSMDGRVDRTFRANRIGLCLLHPQSLAGQPIVVRTPDGPVPTRFPTEIHPHFPLPDLTGLTYGGLAIELDGGLFETEDQRNWTDPSFKTYTPPLRTGYPRTFTEGARIRQRIVLSTTASGHPRSRRPDDAVHVSLGGAIGDRLARIGVAVPGTGGPLTTGEAKLVTACRPAFLHAEIDLTEPATWPQTLDTAAADARRTGVPLHLEVVCDEPSRLRDLRERLDGVPVARLMVYDRTTTPERLARRAHAEFGDTVPIGGGSRAHLAELNRAVLPLDLLDVVGYSVSPEVHAQDAASVMATLQAQPATLARARAIAAGRPVAIGPVTLRQRFNPVATGPERPTPPGSLPSTVDPRQATWFTAAWTVGCLGALGPAESLTMFEAAGWCGLIPREDRVHHPEFPDGDEPFPVYRVLRAIAGWPGRPLLAATGTGTRVAALCVDIRGRAHALLANLTDAPLTVTVDVNGAPPDLVAALPEPGREPQPMRGPHVVLGPYDVVAVTGPAPATP